MREYEQLHQTEESQMKRREVSVTGDWSWW